MAFIQDDPHKSYRLERTEKIVPEIVVSCGVANVATKILALHVGLFVPVGARLEASDDCPRDPVPLFLLPST